MHNKKGITMINLIIYVASFLVIAGIIASITAFFYSNTALLDEEMYSAAEFNKLNAYFVKESEEDLNKVREISLDGEETNYIEFTNNDRYTFDKENHYLYYNSVLLCEDVQGFKTEKSYTNGKEVIKLIVNFTNKAYSCKYTMK